MHNCTKYGHFTFHPFTCLEAHALYYAKLTTKQYVCRLHFFSRVGYSLTCSDLGSRVHSGSLVAVPLILLDPSQILAVHIYTYESNSRHRSPSSASPGPQATVRQPLSAVRRLDSNVICRQLQASEPARACDTYGVSLDHA